MSTGKNIPTRERLIFALDVADAAAARLLVERLGDAVRFYKIGLELLMSGSYFELLDWLVARERRVFVDLKFFDVPATVAAAVRGLRNRGVTFATVHGNQSIMEAAAAAKGEVKILAVTVLTSLAVARSKPAATASCPPASKQSSCVASSIRACSWSRPASAPWRTGRPTTRNGW
jgi:orotidine-5'-phosphate decarboxylase